MRKLLLPLLAMIVLSVGAPSAPARSAQLHEVIMDGGPALLFTYTPDDLTIAKRDRIAWSNPTNATHHVTFYNSPVIDSIHVPPGGAEIKRFKKKGDYFYRCDITGHSLIAAGVCVGMCGRFTVE